MARQSSPTPAAPKQGRLRQIWQMFKLTRQVDPAVVWWMLGTFLLVVAVGVAFGFLFHLSWWLVIPAFVISGLMLAIIVMARRAERAIYAQAEGQPGATAMALQNLRGWNVESDPVALDPRTQDLVFRAVGRPGVILVTEGPLPRVAKLSDQHAKQLRRLLGEGVPVTVYHAGKGENQIPLQKLNRTITKAKPVLTKGQVAEVSKRLRAIGGIRPPVPKGIDPTRMRPDRRAMRGR